jgi:hypothetical protein
MFYKELVTQVQVGQLKATDFCQMGKCYECCSWLLAEDEIMLHTRIGVGTVVKFIYHTNCIDIHCKKK